MARIKVKKEDKPDPHVLLEKIVATGVLHRLGTPKNHAKTTAKYLFDDNFRVNVWVVSGDGIKVEDSFFVVSDEAGGIIRSTPDVKKKYTTEKEADSLCEGA